MHDVPVILKLDDSTYKDFCSGSYKLLGIAVDNKHRIRKHINLTHTNNIPKAEDSLRFIQKNKNIIIRTGIGALIIGIIVFFSYKARQKVKKQFVASLLKYIEISKKGPVSIEDVNDLIENIDTMRKLKISKNIPLKLSAEQLYNILYSIYDYTNQMIRISNISVPGIKIPKKSSKNTADDLQQYLIIQRNILKKAV